MREAIAASLTNVIVFACWLGVPTASPEAAEFNPRAFGERPLGYPVTEFVFVLLAVLYLPLVPAVCGLTRLALLRAEADRAARQGNWERVEWLRG